MKKLVFFFSLLMSLTISTVHLLATDYYVKVTSAPSDWAGDYLIVYEAGIVAFDGSLTTLDAVGNTKAVTITDGKIEATAAMNAIKFTISADASESGWYQLKSASGYYIAGTQKSSNASNGLKSTNSAESKSNYINQPGVGQILSKSADQNMTLRYNTASNQTRFRYYKSGQQAIALYKFEAGESDACATPTFNPAAGAVVSGTQVSISCATSGVTIHYTTDGTTPTASSPTYSSAITVTSAMTIKAIAVKTGLNNSEVASAAYTILTPKTIAQILSSISTTEGAEFLLNDVTVTYANGSNVYVKDATGYLLVYSSISGAANGKILQGLCGKAKLYNGLPEVSSVTKTPTVSSGTAVEPIELNDYPTDADLNKYVTLEDVTFAAAATLSGSVANVNGTFKSSTLIIRNAFKLNNISLATGISYRIVGIVQKYNSDYQIYPISIEEIIEEGAPDAPTFSPAAGTYTEVQSVTLSCATSGATIHYTTDGTTPTASSPTYSSAISVEEDMTINAIAIKNDKSSALATAAYEINLPLPSHDFQVMHKFATGDGFEFPNDWGGSYAEHEITYIDDKVYFASASKQSSNITDRPVVKDGVINLILTNSHKLISAARFDYTQWTTKVPTLTMKYSTDGGESYSDFNPVVSTTDFALQVLDMPEGVNAIQVVGTADKQVGLTSIAFDLVDKPIVTKTVTITAPTNGTLVVKNGNNAIASGDAIEVGTTLTIVATPAEGYKLDAISVKDTDNGSVTISNNTFDVPNKNIIVSATFVEDVRPAATLTLSEMGVTHDVTGNKQNDVIKLPTTATECDKTFVGWDANANCTSAPTYAPGADYTLASTAQTLYAVYANPVAGSTWDVATSVKAGDVVVISTNTGYTTHDLKTAGAISSSIFGCTASTYNANKSQITSLAEGTLQFTIGGNATNGWTLKNGNKYLKVSGAKKVALVDDAETWSISFSGNNATLAPATGDFTAYSIQYNYNNGNDRFTAYNTAQVAISLFKQVVSYENYSTECQAVVTLQSIAISGTASNLVYTNGSHFNPAGLVVTGTYSDASSAPITEGVDWTFDPDPLTEGTTSISVTATVGEISSSAFTVNGITVNAPVQNDDLRGTWAMVTDVAQLAAGKRVVIAYCGLEGNNIVVKTMGEQKTNNRAAVESAPKVQTDYTTIVLGSGTKVFTLVDAGNSKFAIQASNGNYLTSATSGTSNNLLEAENYNLDNAKWTISISDEVASIVAAAGNKTVMQYNSSNTLFSCYGSANQKAVRIYMLQEDEPDTPEPNYEEVRSGLDIGRHYTICLPKKIIAVRGATFWGINNGDASAVYMELQQPPFEAGTPFIFYTTASTLEVVYEGDATDTPVPNGALRGTLSYMDHTALTAAGSQVYLMYNNALHPLGTANNHLDANRAYLLFEELQAGAPAPGRQVKRMPLQTDVTTGFEDAEASAQPKKMLIDGQLFIRCGEKLYNATGSMVK